MQIVQIIVIVIVNAIHPVDPICPARIISMESKRIIQLEPFCKFLVRFFILLFQTDVAVKKIDQGTKGAYIFQCEFFNLSIG